ncbi:MAG: beta-ketoacyl-ACP synthase III [Pseudomonadota bacterium]
MTPDQKTYSRIIGTGGYLPERILSNADLERMVDTSDEWILTRTGIRERRIAADYESTCDLAERAAREALARAGVAPETLDLIIVATTTPDLVFPSTACLLQARLGNRGAPAFDIQAVCTGFVYALDVADKYLRTGAAKRALVVGAETMSRILDWSDRGTCVLFGDGAGAVVLEAGEEPGILSTHIHADGTYSDLLMVPAGVSRNTEQWQSGGACLTMQGNSVFRMAVKTLGEIVDETLASNAMRREDVDWLVPHQANIRIIQATADKLGMPMERVVVTVDRHGNTSGASIPLALHEAVKDGRIQAGETVLMEAFGGGFTWGSVLLKWS